LGKVLSVHRDDSDRMMLGCLVVFGVAAGAAFAAIGQWLGLLADVAAISGCVLMLRRRKRNGAGRIVRHERGLVQTGNGRTTTIAFDDVESITSDRKVSVRSGLQTGRHFVRASGDREISFTNAAFSYADDLLAEIKGQVLPRLRTEALRAFDEGKSVAFGPFLLDQDGIGAGDEPRVPWTQVEGTTIEEGMLYLRGPENRLLTHRGLSLIPNAEILIEMISLASGIAEDESEPS